MMHLIAIVALLCAILILVIYWAFIFPILALIHCIRNPGLTSKAKFVWVCLILATLSVGAAFYSLAFTKSPFLRFTARYVWLLLLISLFVEKQWLTNLKVEELSITPGQRAWIQKVVPPAFSSYLAIRMFRNLHRTVPASVAVQETLDLHSKQRVGIDACFDPIRLHIECMRVNCIYRTLEAARDASVCEGLDEKQKHYNINPQFIVNRQDCLDRLTEIITGRNQNSHGTALRLYCAASKGRSR